MSEVYRELFAERPPRRFVASAAVGRLPMSMLGIATVLTVTQAVGSYAVAGAVSATMLLSQCATAPLIGRLADRHGQARVLRPVIALHVVGLLTMALLVLRSAPSGWLFVAGAVAGGSFPPIGSFVRMRWRHRLHDHGGVRAAFSVEAAIDEISYIVGPLIIVTLAWISGPVTGLVAAAALTALGGLGFASLAESEPPPVRGPAHRASVLLQPGLVLLLLLAVTFGTVIGSVEVSMVAFGGEEGNALVSGPLIAVFSVGGIAAGLAYGSHRWTVSPWRRLLVAVGLLAAATVPLTMASGVPEMTVAILLAGCAFAPALILAYELIDDLVPSGQETQGFAWMQTSLGAGLAVGAGAAGPAVEGHHSGAGLGVAVVAALAGVVLVALGRRTWPEQLAADGAV